MRVGGGEGGVLKGTRGRGCICPWVCNGVKGGGGGER